LIDNIYWNSARAVRRANVEGLAVAARGQGHSTRGQAQVSARLVIDMGGLDQRRSSRSRRTPTPFCRVYPIGFPVGTPLMTPRRWHQQLGSHWPALAVTKRAHDPNNVLTPGLGIFRPCARDLDATREFDEIDPVSA
jgi:FAD/FMN-containing dehydrogenase